MKKTSRAVSADLNQAEHFWKQLKLAAGRKHQVARRKVEVFDQRVGSASR